MSLSSTCDDDVGVSINEYPAAVGWRQYYEQLIAYRLLNNSTTWGFTYSAPTFIRNGNNGNSAGAGVQGFMGDGPSNFSTHGRPLHSYVMWAVGVWGHSIA